MKQHELLEKKKIKHLSIARQISISFFAVILIGSLLLSLPIANQGEVGHYIDHLFTATSSVCVTGLVSVVPAGQYTSFGHLVIIILIQIGGLSFLTLLATALLLMKKKLSLFNKTMIKDSLNIRDSFDIPKFIRKVIKYTLFFEIVGAILLMFEFIPTYGFAKGAWFGVFHSISAFCNAGFDIIGDSNLAPYVASPLINIVVMSLIIIGGIGFAVWFDIHDKIRPLLTRKETFGKFWKSLEFHSKIVLVVTAFLILVGALFIWLLESGNESTLGSLGLDGKMWASLMQSVTLRTAGFSSVNIANLMHPTKLLMMAWMFIGGSPGGTAGGIKTMTFVVVIAAVISMIKGKDDVTIWKRTISDTLVKKAMMVFGLALTVIVSSVFILSITEPNLSVMQIAFEVVSAFCTVGLTDAATPLLSSVGKIIICICMYVGRIGPATLIVSLIRSRHSGVSNDIHYPSGNIIIG